jgi:hypothetical protein
MTRQHGTDAAGNPLNLVGGVIHTGRGAVPGLMAREASPMAKAENNGSYRLNGNEFTIRKGDELPDGAEFIPADSTEERAQPKAPENKSKQAAPENRAKGKDA